jgi:hypothetical protein
MKVCVVCDQLVCASSLNRCPTCGRGTCRERAGLCHAAEGEPARILPTRKRGMAESAEAPPPEPELEPEKVEAPPKPPTSPDGSRRADAKPTLSTRRAIATGQKIEVYTYATEPVITAFVIASKGRELARRTWELVEGGIAV